MKYLFLMWSIVTLLQGCDVLKKDSDYTPLIPEKTPFITGVLEATADTVHHYPEVFVGTLSDPEGFQAKPVWTTPGIWWPVTNAQVTRPVTRMDLKRVADTEAKVTVMGPIGQPNERIVQFTHEGNGIYGDVGYQLHLIGGGTYRLSVVMSDGRRYMAETRIPELFDLNMPDSAQIGLELKQHTNGVYYEQSIQPLSYSFSVDSSVGYLVTQENSEHDYHNLNVPPDGDLLFANRSNFLRFGAHYGVVDAYDFPDNRSVNISWIESDDGSPLRESEYWWLTLNQLNKDLSRFYYSVFPQLSGNAGGRWDEQDWARIEVQKNHDSSYLFDYMSNIKKIGKDGEVLPKEQSNVFGVFGAYSTAYRNLTVIPKRSWDPDTLNWGNQGN